MSTHSHNIDFKKAFTVTKEEKSMVKIAGEIPYEELVAERAGAIKAFGKNLEIDGFRKGHVPEAMVVKHVGEMAILTEMAERAISHFYHHILEAHEIDAIGHPKIEITKIAPNNPLGFTATVAVLPEITLPDYKKIADTHNKEKASDKVSDEELETKIKDILRQKVAYERLQNKASNQTTEGENLPNPETIEKEEDIVIPELTDEVAKSLGQAGQFSGVEDFKTKLREHLEIEKKNEVATTHRAKLTDAIIENSTIELPQVLVDHELNQMFAQMEDDLGRANLKMEDYLKHIKKTREDIKNDWTPAAEKRAKLQLILNKIAKEEKITPDEKLVENQVKDILAMYKNANEHNVHTYVSTILTNEAVLKMLEGGK
jgi:trigger factor